MHRCLQLAELASGNVAPNPMVGAVLVYNDRIIGEGYHQQYGMPHAEVNCINAVRKEDEHLIPESRLYVSLEPCAHYGKTPPCADLIIQRNIPEVIVGCRDPFPLVNGRGIEKLEAAGVRVVKNVLESECKILNKRFFTFHTRHRPYIILKWAQSKNNIIGSLTGERVHISNDYSNRLVHRWRSEEAAILIGTNTALLDNPALTTRLWPGKNPVRLVVDIDLRLPGSLHLFDDSVPTIIFNRHRNTIESFNDFMVSENKTCFYQVTQDVSMVQQVTSALHHLKLQSVLIEGGARLLQSFIDEGMWDEARVITNETLLLSGGVNAPAFTVSQPVSMQHFLSDRVAYYFNPSPSLS